jgi:hypothetical protein
MEHGATPTYARLAGIWVVLTVLVFLLLTAKALA